MVDEKVRFLNEHHQYFIGDRELISVSAFTKLFEEKKDWNAIAKKYAKKHGGTAEEWNAKWKNKAKLSSEAGTILHSMREEALMEQSLPEFFGVKCEKLQCQTIDGVKWGIDISNLPFNTVFPELIIHDEEYGISGQTDKAITTDTHIHIMDYKTDKDIKFKGYSSQWKRPEKFLPPLQHLDYCNGNEYSLKMSMYMYLIWRKNKHLKPGKIIIEHIHLKRDEDDIPILIDGFPLILKEELIELPYRKTEVIDMLKHYKQTQLQNEVNN